MRDSQGRTIGKLEGSSSVIIPGVDLGTCLRHGEPRQLRTSDMKIWCPSCTAEGAEIVHPLPLMGGPAECGRK